MRIRVACVFMGAQTKRQQLVHGAVTQRLLTVQNTVDIELYVLTLLVKGDRDVLPLSLGHRLLGEYIFSVDVRVVLAIGAQGQQRASIPLVLKQHGRCRVLIPCNGLIIPIPHRKGNLSFSRVDVIFQLQIVVGTRSKSKHVPKYRISAVHNTHAVTFQCGRRVLSCITGQRIKAPMVLELTLWRSSHGTHTHRIGHEHTTCQHRR